MEVAAEAEDEVVEEIEADHRLEAVPHPPPTLQHQASLRPDTRAPSTLTCPRGSGRGASYIINGGVLLIFVPNQ